MSSFMSRTISGTSARSHRSHMDYDEARIQKLQRTDTSLSQRAQELEGKKTSKVYHERKKIKDQRARISTEIEGRQATQDRQRQDFIRLPRDPDHAATRFSQILDDGQGFERTYVKTDGEALSRPMTADAKPSTSSSRHGTTSSSSRPRTSSSAQPGPAQSANLSRQNSKTAYPGPMSRVPSRSSSLRSATSSLKSKLKSATSSFKRFFPRRPSQSQSSNNQSYTRVETQDPSSPYTGSQSRAGPSRSRSHRGPPPAAGDSARYRKYFDEEEQGQERRPSSSRSVREGSTHASTSLHQPKPVRIHGVVRDERTRARQDGYPGVAKPTQPGGHF